MLSNTGLTTSWRAVKVTNRAALIFHSTQMACLLENQLGIRDMTNTKFSSSSTFWIKRWSWSPNVSSAANQLNFAWENVWLTPSASLKINGKELFFNGDFKMIWMLFTPQWTKVDSTLLPFSETKTEIFSEKFQLGKWNQIETVINIFYWRQQMIGSTQTTYDCVYNWCIIQATNGWLFN